MSTQILYHSVVFGGKSGYIVVDNIDEIGMMHITVYHRKRDALAALAGLPHERGRSIILPLSRFLQMYRPGDRRSCHNPECGHNN
jgi:hypothetical protein